MSLGSKFDCNANSGGRCAPMHHINRMASYGTFNESQPFPSNTNELVYIQSKQNQNKQDTGKSKKFEQELIRSNETIQQIWIGPYEDTNGNYHEGSNVYTVVKKGRWIGNPVSAISD